MRRILVVVSCVVFASVLGACGSNGNGVGSATTSTRTASTSTTSTTRVAATTSTSAAVTTTTGEACPNSGSSGPRSTPADQPAALLTNVAITNAGCRDRVTFTFRRAGSSAPSCKVEYRNGPFAQDGSGELVSVAGAAFVSVRCEPAYGYDYLSGTPTYTGAKRLAATGTRHVREVVETGDFEAVLNWVIGLDARRSFTVSAGGTSARQLVITFS